MKLLNYILILICMISCKENNRSRSDLPRVPITTNHPSFIEKIETAHKKNKFLTNQTVCLNIEISFGEKSSKFKLLTTPNSSAIKIEKLNGITSIYKDGAFHTNADSTMWEKELFNLFTYHYFFMVPYKLSDQGTNWQKLPNILSTGANTNSAQLTFNSDIGASPNDWYIIHYDTNTDIIRYMGYIITEGKKSVVEAEKDAHAIKYENYQDVDGIPISHQWKFYNYSKENGLGNNLFGEAKLNNVIFMNTFEDTYDTTDLTKIQ